MPVGSRVCPHCGRLNAVDDSTCFNCKKRLPGPALTAVSSFWSELAADGAPLTKVIAAICVLSYAAMMVTDGPFKLDLSVAGSFRSSSLLRFGATSSMVADAEPYRLLSAMYVHMGVLHIVMNMFGLTALGRDVERRLGSARFFLVYTLAGVIGFAVGRLWYDYTQTPYITAGASGALFGLYGARVAELWRDRRDWRRQLVNYTVGALIWNFVMPMNTAAHLGGLFGGAAVAMFFEWERRPGRREALMRGLAGACMLLTLGSIALSMRSPAWRTLRAIEDERALRARFSAD